jgi:acetolactate synthase I/II/III large subunit
MPKIRVADFIAEWIGVELGIRHVFMVTGAGSMHLTDAIAKHDSIKEVCLHHEQAVAMAVESYSRVSGQIGVAYVSTGPAATNALTGLAGAWQDSVACLFVSGQVKMSETSRNSGVPGLRQFGVQELDIIPIVESVTKYVAQVAKPADILYELGKAKFFASKERPGPVWLEVPLDVQSAYVERSELIEFVPPGKERIVSSSNGTAGFFEALAKSERPVVVIGQGVRLSNSETLVREFLHKHRIPVVSTYLGVDSYTPHDDLYMGKIGVKGERAANIVTQKADLLLVLGASLHVSSIGYNYDEFAPDAEKWIVDIDTTSHMKPTLNGQNLVCADIGSFLRDFAAEEELSKGSSQAWTQWAQIGTGLKLKFPTHDPEYEKESEGINIYTVVEEVSQNLEPQDVVVSDAGSAFYSVSQGIRLGEDNRYLTSGAMATMGYSLPASIGISFGAPGARIFAFTGDGSLHQNIQELGQMKFLGLPIVLIVLNNSGYLSIRASQSNYFESRFIGTDEQSGLGLPNISAISEAYGLSCYRIESLATLRAALGNLTARPEPVVFDVKTPSNQPIVPTVSSRLNESGGMTSRAIHDMTPLVDPAELEEIMRPKWGF